MKYNKMKATIKGRTHNNHPNFPDHEFEVILFFLSLFLLKLEKSTMELVIT